MVESPNITKPVYVPLVGAVRLIDAAEFALA